MGIKELKPAVEHGVRDVKPGTELSDRIPSGKILCNDTEDEKETVNAVGNDQVRENGMSMAAAAADHPADTDVVVNRSAGDEINEIAVVGSMKLAGVGSTTVWAGFFFRTKTGHK